MPWRKRTEYDPQPIEGEPLRFHVRSRNDPEPYLVDLAEFCGNGRCGCQDFRTRKEPKLEAGALPATWLECWHITAAKRWLAEEVIRRIAKDS